MNFKDPFSKQENFKKDEINLESQISKEKDVIIKELSSLGEKTENYFDFEDTGSDFEPAKINKQAAEGLNEAWKSEVEYRLNFLKSYEHSPIFTDSFYEKHRDVFKKDKDNIYRVDWEEEYIKNMNNTAIRDEVRKFYESNRLNASRFKSCMGYILELKDEMIKNKELRKELEILYKKIPNKLLENEKGVLEYDLLSNEEKIDLIKNFSNIVSQVVSLLEEKENLSRKINLTSEEKRELYKKVLRGYSGTVLNSDKLGEYSNSKLSTTELMRRLKDSDLLEIAKEFEHKINVVPVFGHREKGEIFEIIARLTLKEALGLEKKE